MGGFLSLFSSVEEAKETEITVLSWNIDGLHKLKLERAEDIGNTINARLPDVVLLQEVVYDTLALLRKCCKGYTFTSSRVEHYFNTIMVRKGKFKPINKEKLVFSNSVMGRYLVIQTTEVYGIPFTFFTSHLESMKESSARRKEQMATSFEEMVKRGVSSNVIFAGDMNIEEFEVTALGGLPDGVSDAWEVCGKEEDTQFTWDMKLNDNLKFVEDGRELPRRRYDRMYYMSLMSHGIKCTKFQLIGRERIEDIDCFPSDHYGMLVTFSFSDAED